MSDITIHMAFVIVKYFVKNESKLFKIIVNDMTF